MNFPKSPLVEHSVRRPDFSLEKKGSHESTAPHRGRRGTESSRNVPSSRQISLSIQSISFHCLRLNTAGHALTGGHKQAARHASETHNSSERLPPTFPHRYALRTYHITHTLRHGGRPFSTSRVECSNSRELDSRNAPSWPSQGLLRVSSDTATLSLRLGIIRSWGASHPSCSLEHVRSMLTLCTMPPQGPAPPSRSGCDP
jgi:hypothetical protein